MATVWGRAEVIIDVNGNNVVRRVREIAREAGDAGGRDAGESFSKSFSRAIGKSDSFKGLTDKSRGLGSALQRLSGLWRGLSRNTQVWAVIIGSLIAGLPAMAALTSALSGGLVILATTLLAAAAGAGVAVAAFIGLYDETLTLSAGALASKDAFTALGDTFKSLQGDITNAFFGGMADSINAVTSAVTTLSPVITAFAQTAGEQLGRVFEALSSERAIGFFRALFDEVDGLGPILESLTTAAIQFGHAIGDVIVASLPFAQQFAGWLAQIATEFANWTAQNPGVLEQFFQTAATILPAVAEAVAELGAQFASLVTPAVINDTVNLLTGLSEGLQFIFDLAAIIGGLDIFGNLIAAFSAVSALFHPLAEGLTQVATVIGDLLFAKASLMVPLFAAIGALLGPLATNFGSLAEQIGTALLPLVDALLPLFEALVPIFAAAGETLALIGQTVATLVLPILIPLIDLVAQVAQELTPLVEELLPLFITLFDASAVALQALSPILLVVAQIIGAVLTQAVTILIGILRVVTTIIIGVSQALNSVLAPALKSVQGVVTEFGNFWRDVWNQASQGFTNFGNVVSDVFSNVIGWIQDAMSWIGSLISAISRLDFGAIGNLFGGGAGGGGGGGGLAAGGVLYGPRRILAGEAGPEAIVPLDRPLRLVDPSVRALSAIAQGLTPMASGGIVSGRTPLAITQNIFQNGDPRRMALMVADRIAERVAG